MSNRKASSKRRRFSPSEKTKAVKKCLVEKRPVSEVCEEEGIKPTHYYTWQKQLFENGEQAFTPDNSRREKSLEKKIQELEAQLVEKDQVIGDIMTDFCAFKKKLNSQ